MPKSIGLSQPFWLLALAAPIVLSLTSATATASASPVLGLFWNVEPGQSIFEWEAPFSIWRWVIFVVGVSASWFLAFHVIMLSSLALDNSKPPRPRAAFARAAGWFILFAAISFDVVFAVIGNDLYYRAWTTRFPSPLTPLNYHFIWIGVLFLGLFLMFLVRYMFRR